MAQDTGWAAAHVIPGRRLGAPVRGEQSLPDGMLPAMTGNPTGLEAMKRAAALRALTLVESGMLLGLGTGSTAWWLVAELAESLKRGDLQNIRCVATSRQTEEQASGLGLSMIELPAGGVDVAIDGMDELTPGLQAIKGLGGALTREKIVAASATRFVLIGDESKCVTHLGEKAPLPVEVVRFGQQRTAQLLAELGAEPQLRVREGAPFLTDNGNVIYDLRFAGPFDATAVAAQLAAMPGVVEHGLFLGMTERAYVAGATSVTEFMA